MEAREKERRSKGEKEGGDIGEGKRLGTLPFMTLELVYFQLVNAIPLIPAACQKKKNEKKIVHVKLIKSK